MYMYQSEKKKKLIFGEYLGRRYDLSKPSIFEDDYVRRGDILMYKNAFYMVMAVDLKSIICIEIKRGNPVWEWWEYPLLISPKYIKFGYNYKILANCDIKMPWELYTGWFVNEWSIIVNKISQSRPDLILPF